jgi:hypothetical protein
LRRIEEGFVRKTPVDLYRMGNAASPRLENIRMKDIEIYEQEGRQWVTANSGGISTFSIRGSGRNWWKLDQGSEIPNELRVVNDYSNHWLWEPSYSMPIDDYRQALELVGEQFYKIS